jgi:hypothetical protein
MISLSSSRLVNQPPHNHAHHEVPPSIDATSTVTPTVRNQDHVVSPASDTWDNPARPAETTARSAETIPQNGTHTAIQGTSSLPGVAQDPWPAWAVWIAVAIVFLALGCAGLHVGRALSACWAAVRRKAPQRLVWAVRTTTLPVSFGSIVLAMITGTVTFLTVRRVQESVVDTTPAIRPNTPMHVQVPAQSVAPVTTSPATSPAAFVRNTVPLLERHGLTHAQALLFCAHLARETGWGRWVSHHNFGNIKAGPGWTGATFRLIDARGFSGKYRAWSSAEEGIGGAVSLIRDSLRYHQAWTMLQSIDSHWYGQLGLSGYYEGPPNRERPGEHTIHSRGTVSPVQREYNSIVTLVRRYDAIYGDLATRETSNAQ